MNIANIGIGFVLVLGVLILVHEWGHFVVARLFGVRVDVFSIGFGPRLFGWKRGATDYRVSAIPLGGYVRMAGQDLSEIDSGEQKPTGAPDELMSKKRWQRALISLAEPVVDKRPAEKKFQVTFEHKGELRTDEVTTAGMQVPQLLFGDPPNRPIVGFAEKDKPAYRAGIRRDDIVVSINSKPLNNWQEMVTAIQNASGKPMQVGVVRGKEALAFTVNPVFDKNGRGESAWVIGIRPGQEYSFRKVGVTQAVASASDLTVRGAWQVFDIVGKLVTGKVAFKELQSVVGIASEAGHAVQEGTFGVVSFMTTLSLNLGVLNLLPI